MFLLSHQMSLFNQAASFPGRYSGLQSLDGAVTRLCVFSIPVPVPLTHYIVLLEGLFFGLVLAKYMELVEKCKDSKPIACGCVKMSRVE